MTWTPSATRADVVRMVARYVRLEFSIRSGAGKLVIDESRTARKRKVKVTLAEIGEMGFAETLDAIHTASIRRAVYATPEAPRVLSTDTYGGEHVSLRRVAPIRDVAAIVHAHPTRGSATRNDARDWRATVAQKIQRLPRDEAAAILEAEEVRLELQELRNQLDQRARAARRLKAGGRNARNLKRHADVRVDELKSREGLLSDRLRSLTRTRAHRDAFDRLLVICTETEEIETYLFGEER